MSKLNRVIIDVRTPDEFREGHVKGSVNIPLQSIHDRMDEINSYQEQGILLCCASGMRSEQAMMFLKRKGIDCENGGSWRDVERMVIN